MILTGVVGPSIPEFLDGAFDALAALCWDMSRAELADDLIGENVVHRFSLFCGGLS